jgi:peptidyl-tRNA hydrolase
VIGKWKSEEETKLKKIFARTIEATEAFANGDIEKAMLIANTK